MKLYLSDVSFIGLPHLFELGHIKEQNKKNLDGVYNFSMPLLFCQLNMNTISEEKGENTYHFYAETRRNWGSFGQCLSCNRPVVKCPIILEARKTILKETVSPSLICLEVVWLTRLGYDMRRGMIMT
jgi:hypothetical protein